ncbi:Na+-transporting methylmalonyl-CoA/oxaloacetate decarboxylase, gamma subunit [Candidatus Scalindua japonica]|uniref:Na+-transporting methylmalonyl-CoA/oxaloacetate decarboxylase, gamma subunit n=1 Tax=Candidatus Scalindua japonica TaxID=1284222 RepID=A0A286TU10_9BACT|nr:OadG family protein [Candidatus Scalindua japonica]GAX59354.1 Na+-transporting methylmalonyl-CoA/oxaloacetate decarboxylase, gamma subunit [Candidatus Scalindua japonica]
MIGNAIMLMFIGMGIVFVFLVLLNAAISLLEYFTREHTRNEESAMAEADLARKNKKKRKSMPASGSHVQTAVISAAIHAYRKV